VQLPSLRLHLLRERNRLAEVGSACSGCPTLSRSSPRQVSALGRKTSSAGFAWSASSIVTSASSILPSSACASVRNVRLAVINSLNPASAMPAKPWRISATPSLARPSCARAQPSGGEARGNQMPCFSVRLTLARLQPRRAAVPVASRTTCLQKVGHMQVRKNYCYLGRTRSPAPCARGLNRRDPKRPRTIERKCFLSETTKKTGACAVAPTAAQVRPLFLECAFDWRLKHRLYRNH
jgi:hypothetical protein